MSQVALRDVNKVYPGGHHAVSDLSVDIAEGEFLVLVGPSGCGKSTALRMIAGLETITTGTLEIGERVVNDVHPADRDIAMVFQNYALYPHMTVRQNISFALRLGKLPKEDVAARVAEAARILELTELLDRKPRQLSGGQRQRVAMGRAIVRRPAAFLMDEPLSNLDAKLRVQMRAEIARIQRDLKVTTIYVTHDQIEAMTMGHRVAVMKHGVLQQIDSPQRLYDHPANLFVAAFIGSPAMNLLVARLEDRAGAVHLRIGRQDLELPAAIVRGRPALRRHVGSDVVVGVRPEDLRDVSADREHPLGERLTANVDLTEALGSDVMVHLRVEGENALTKDVEALADDAGGGGHGNGALVLARFPRTSRVRVGETIELGVDMERLHLFERDGAAIRD
jgi:multiple sugar transport system ATP-binding protein